MTSNLKSLASVGCAVFLLTLPLQAQIREKNLNTGQTEAAIAIATGSTESLAAQHPNNDAYKIGNDDRLSINVWKEPDFTETLPVRSDGKISLPLIGDMQASGLTPRQLEVEIATKLQTYMTDPQVTVIVMQINSQKFNILGRVTKPGAYPLTTSTTVLDAIAEAGGFQDFAKKSKVYILRQKPDGSETRMAFNYKAVIQGKHPEENVRLQSGDTIVVP